MIISSTNLVSPVDNGLLTTLPSLEAFEFSPAPMVILAFFSEELAYNCVRLLVAKTGWILPPVHSTIITMKPKKDNPLSFLDFTPVSLCNFLLKLFTTISPKKLVIVNLIFIQGMEICDIMDFARDYYRY